MFSKYLPALFAVLLLFSCADPKKASNSTFKAAIQKYFDERPPGIAVVVPGDEGIVRGIKNERMEALVAAGILSRTEATIMQHSILTGGDYKEPAFHYEITAKGKPFLYEFSYRTAVGETKAQRIKYAEKRVIDIIRFSEPGSALGHTISEVSFTYSLENIAPWAKDPAIQNALQITDQVASEGKPVETKMMLELMSDGWRSTSDL